jgi:hypothetical protein
MAGLGCVMSQDGKVVEYASRAMTQTEMQYAQIEKEQLAILFAVERWHTYLYAKRGITVETDHKPLLAIHKKSLAAAPKRLQRMLLRLQRYDFKLVYRPGNEMLLADTLSRAFPSDTAEHTACPEEIESLSAVDDDQIAEFEMIASKDTVLHKDLLQSDE